MMPSKPSDVLIFQGKRGQKRGREEDAPVGQKSNKKSRVEVVDGF